MSHNTFVPRLHMAADNLRCGNKEKALEDIRSELEGGMTRRQVAAYMSKHCKADMTVDDLKELLDEPTITAHLSRGYVDPFPSVPEARVVETACVSWADDVFGVYVYFARGDAPTLNVDYVRGSSMWTDEEELDHDMVPGKILNLINEGYHIVGTLTRRD